MKALTYLNALRNAKQEMSHDAMFRDKRESGIAVDNDSEALSWQRHERQAKKFERALRIKLGDTTHNLVRKHKTIKVEVQS